MQQQFLKSDKTATSTYGEDTVREVLARASEIDAQQKNAALTAGQIETLGRELGLSPDAIRQALLEKVNPPVERVLAPTVHGLPPVTRQDIKTGVRMAALLSAIGALVIVGLYLLTHAFPRTPSIALLTVFFVGAFYLAAVAWIAPFVYAWRRTDWRQGAILTATLLLIYTPVALLAGVVGSVLTDEAMPSIASIPLLPITLVSLVSGVVGGLAGKWWHDRKLAEER